MLIQSRYEPTPVPGSFEALMQHGRTLASTPAEVPSVISQPRGIDQFEINLQKNAVICTLSDKKSMQVEDGREKEQKLFTVDQHVSWNGLR